MGITKGVLKRPVTTILVVLCLFVFGLSSVLSSKMELTPEMNFPMLLISSVYPGANPEDVNDLVTRPVEEAVGTLSGIKNVQSSSQENVSIVVLEYEYGSDMNKAYSDLKKKMDNLDLPDDVETPSVMEFNINEMPVVTLAVKDPSQNNLYNYVNDKIVPEFEKISSVASVGMSGGQKGYVSVRLIPEKMNQYHLTMNSISQAIKAADFTYPAGNTGVGKRDLSVSTGVEVGSVESLKKVPVVAGDGKTIYMEDIADITSTSESQEAIGRYNGEDTITLSINKQQKNSAVDVSKSVTRTIETLKREFPNLDIVVIDDTSDQITSALNSVKNTMVMAVVISMIIIFLFFGDIKASLIVGSSIPVSILVSLILMAAMGFSLNVITMSSIVLGVGMMVDNSIVVMESCFRSQKGTGFREYMQAALEGTGVVLQSILGGTITTCVVFIPLALLEGLTGQMFKPLGYTIVFCMLASLLSAITIVPLCYSRFRPVEKQNSPMGGLVKALQNGYRRIVDKLLNRRAAVMIVSVLLLISSFVLATRLGFELMPEVDQGTITVTAEIKPGLKVEEADKILKKLEDIVTSEEDLKSYMVSYGGSGLSFSGAKNGTLTAYLKSDRKLSTNQMVNKWKKAMNQLPDCNVTVESTSSMSRMSRMSRMSSKKDFEVILQSSQLDKLKSVSKQMVDELTQNPQLIKVHSDLENAAPVVKVRVDPIKAAAEGIAPSSIGSLLNGMLSGTKASTMDVAGQEVDIKVEYPEDSYDTLDKVEGIMIPNSSGGSVALTDIADIGYEDSPTAINRKNKQYLVTITGSFTDVVKTAKDKEAAKKNIDETIVNKYLNDMVTRAKNSEDESMQEEFSSLFKAIATAIFLIFIVMAAQFESPKFSLMVMTTIPFSLIGSFGFLAAAGVAISMPSLLGFLMLIGTVVNSGILYVDTVNQYRATMDKRTALIEAGATRLRPILMTTLTTVVAMIPMAMAIGKNGETMQGLALVNVGGLTASTILSLLMLPIYYSLMSGKTDKNLLPD
ncbi:efflux RND transporter permease subunit [Lacrimispora saccharolytica]|uniref:Acriflavin resistance protein n=1 Tax=Lacrimispora saccharolytica (strain ATCC 35040 / DSM 2544 / NRCC 2533 / WM1) TaxID=610130 RepID=D9R447_LACSW|nr:efflux RND transporter permease subunit [Lacrimispora saccharolytica]ADL03160.1 acriflavin resistance protein [[Clostridium] saccharolyticum WM1]QRV18663.1 efflux RND transporter permease subunit [Lacrimispora saccharolytica]